MIVVNLNKIVHSYGTQLVLDSVSWEIQAGQKIGFVGPSGAGKSTLLRLIAGETRPDGGSVYRSGNTHIGYLAQEPDLDPHHTVWEEMMGASADLARLEAELRRLEARMAQPEVYNKEAALERVLAAHARFQAEFEQLDGYRYESRAREALHTLNLVGLAKVLVLATRSVGSSAPWENLLLLDEPDNHLDLAGKAYLEQFIASFPGTVILVSHDRYLLDGSVTQIVEVEDQRLTTYQGNYSAYAVEKQLRQLRQQQRYEAQQK